MSDPHDRPVHQGAAEIMPPFAAVGMDMSGSNPLVPQSRGPVPGSDTDRAMAARVITAQHCAIPRDLRRIRANIAAEAAAAGMAFVYRIPFKDRASGKTTYVEGPTIRCTEAVARIYGNCTVIPDVKDTGTHFLFTHTFVDYETGYAVPRMFLQRKSQNTGMGDADRRLDMIFQIGQSKSMRNAIRAGLGFLCDEAVSIAKNDMVTKIGAKLAETREWLKQRIAALGVDIVRVERVHGAVLANWTAPVMAKIFMEYNSVNDGMALADDLWPTDEVAAAAAREGQQTEATETAVVNATTGEVEETQQKDPPAQQQAKPASTRKPRASAKTDEKPKEEEKPKEDPPPPPAEEKPKDPPPPPKQPDPPPADDGFDWPTD